MDATEQQMTMERAVRSFKLAHEGSFHVMLRRKTIVGGNAEILSEEVHGSIHEYRRRSRFIRIMTVTIVILVIVLSLLLLFSEGGIAQNL